MPTLLRFNSIALAALVALIPVSSQVVPSGDSLTQHSPPVSSIVANRTAFLNYGGADRTSLEQASEAGRLGPPTYYQQPSNHLPVQAYRHAQSAALTRLQESPTYGDATGIYREPQLHNSHPHRNRDSGNLAFLHGGNYAPLQLPPKQEPYSMPSVYQLPYNDINEFLYPEGNNQEISRTNEQALRSSTVPVSPKPFVDGHGTDSPAMHFSPHTLQDQRPYLQLPDTAGRMHQVNQPYGSQFEASRFPEPGTSMNSLQGGMHPNVSAPQTIPAKQFARGRSTAPVAQHYNNRVYYAPNSPSYHPHAQQGYAGALPLESNPVEPKFSGDQGGIFTRPYSHHATTSPQLQQLYTQNGGATFGLLQGLSSPISANQLKEIQAIASDLAACDAKTQGVCCVARNYCDANATCTSDATPDTMLDLINAIPKCTCNWGFEGDGRSNGTGCINIDECATGEAGCEQICKDFAPGYACSCYTGYELLPNGKQCQDINECLFNNGGCQHSCVNTLGSYFCKCAPGYILGSDGHHCTEGNACADWNNGMPKCDHTCTSILGMPVCSCNPGYKVNPSDRRMCLDRNECIEGLGDGRPACAQNNSQICTNMPGSYSCTCNSGYRKLESPIADVPTARTHGASTSSNEHRDILEDIHVQSKDRYSTTSSLRLLDGSRDDADVPGTFLHGNQSGVRTEANMPNTPEKGKHPQVDILLEQNYPYVSAGSPADVVGNRGLNSNIGGTSEIQIPYDAHNQGEWDTNVSKGSNGAVSSFSRSNSITPPQLLKATTFSEAYAPQRRLQVGDAVSSIAAATKVAHAVSASSNKAKIPSANLMGGVDASQVADLTKQLLKVASTASTAVDLINGTNKKDQNDRQKHHRNIQRSAQMAAQLGSAAERFVHYESWSTAMQEIIGKQQMAMHPQQDMPTPQMEAQLVCEDIDECAEGEKANKILCSTPEQICINIPGSFECRCPEGFEWDKAGASSGACVDVNECALAELVFSVKTPNAQRDFHFQKQRMQLLGIARTKQLGTLIPGKPAICDHGCVNTVGSYECRCAPGYTINPDGSCTDIDECANKLLNKCTQKCENTEGGHRCLCYDGFELNYTTNDCVDVDECQSGTAKCSHICTNTPGTYVCKCPEGFALGPDNATCKPQRTCLEDSTLCKGDLVCLLDQQRSEWMCKCPKGFELGHRSTLSRPACTDIDECKIGFPQVGQNPCLDPLRPCCINIAGGFQCMPMRLKNIMNSRSLYCEPPSGVFGSFHK